MLRTASAADGSAGDHGGHADDIIYPSAIPFVLVHMACFAAVWSGVGAFSARGDCEACDTCGSALAAGAASTGAGRCSLDWLLARKRG